jgi:hypothetical protein
VTQRFPTPAPSSPVHTVALAPHSEAQSTAVRAISVRVRRVRDTKLMVTYVLEGAIDRICVPAPRPPRIADRLWHHTCFEILIRREALPGYHEFNLAPSGEWAAYAFERYRKGAPLVDEMLDPQVTVRSAAGKLELEALIRLDPLSPAHARSGLALALCAVVEERDGTVSYWALRHAAGKPDFHHSDAFALHLDEVRD